MEDSEKKVALFVESADFSSAHRIATIDQLKVILMTQENMELVNAYVTIYRYTHI